MHIPTALLAATLLAVALTAAGSANGQQQQAEDGLEKRTVLSSQAAEHQPAEIQRWGRYSPSTGAGRYRNWMDGNAYRTSFGKRASASAGMNLNAFRMGSPMLADGGGPLLAMSLVDPSQQLQQSDDSGSAIMNMKRLDRNIYHVGFGRRRK